MTPFQGWDRWWAGQPGALPRAGVCRAVGAPGSCKASQVWGRHMGGLVDGDGHPFSGVLRQRWRDVFPHGSASLRLGGRFSQKGVETSFETLAWHLPQCESAGGGSRLPPWRTEARHPCRRVRARGLQDGQDDEIHRRVWVIPSPSPVSRRSRDDSVGREVMAKQVEQSLPSQRNRSGPARARKHKRAAPAGMTPADAAPGWKPMN